MNNTLTEFVTKLRLDKTINKSWQVQRFDRATNHKEQKLCSQYLIFFVTENWPNNQECLSLASFFGLV